MTLGLVDRVDAPKLGRAILDQLDDLALEFLVSPNGLEDLTRRVMRDLQSVYYVEREHQGALIACRDGSLLFANRQFVPYGVHRLAFRDGLRTPRALLRERRDGLVTPPDTSPESL